MSEKSSTEKVATIDHCIHCFDSLVAHFQKSKVPTPLFTNNQYPLFVTWSKHSSTGIGEPSLRGCKGTFQPQFIHTGLGEFALISALKDTRFSPISHTELARLECCVSLLFAFEECLHSQDWEVGKHGIIIDFRDPDGIKRNATYLPEVAIEQGKDFQIFSDGIEWDKMETLESLIKKAGWDGKINKDLLSKIKTTRYQSSTSTLHYKDYVSHKELIRVNA